MSTRLPVGWDVSMAVNDYSPPHGRACIMVGGTWSDYSFAGLHHSDPGNARNTLFLADSTAAVLMLVEWLAGPGAHSILYLGVKHYPDDPTEETGFMLYTNENPGMACQKALVEAGHTITPTGSSISLNGHEPLDYDIYWGFYIPGTYHGSTNSAVKMNYLLTHGGNAMSGGSIGDAGMGPWVDHGFSWGYYTGGAHADLITGVDHGYRIHYNPDGSHGPYVAQDQGWQDQRPFSGPPYFPECGGNSYGTPHWVVPITYVPQPVITAGSHGGYHYAIPCAVAEDKTAYESHYWQDHTAWKVADSYSCGWAFFLWTVDPLPGCSEVWMP